MQGNVIDIDPDKYSEKNSVCSAFFRLECFWVKEKFHFSSTVFSSEIKSNLFPAKKKANYRLSPGKLKDTWDSHFFFFFGIHHIILGNKSYLYNFNSNLHSYKLGSKCFQRHKCKSLMFPLRKTKTQWAAIWFLASLYEFIGKYKCIWLEGLRFQRLSLSCIQNRTLSAWKLVPHLLR